MRDIKFRAYFEEKFWYFTLNEIMERAATYQGDWDIKALRASKQRFIGRHDINGKEVYEGDIVKCKDSLTGRDFKGVVDFRNCSFVIKNSYMTYYRWHDYDIEIIGNKWENPELMDDEEEE